jgi:predicted ATPase/DNA-binding SARP family transcriptional activator
LARLYISLFGSYSVTLDGNPLSGFDSDKTRLLLTYLAVEAGKPHRRESLVGLFWPEQPEAHARQNLSQALYNLRQMLGERGGTGPLFKDTPPQPGGQFLLSDSLTVQFNPYSSHILDIRLFSELVTACHTHSHRYLEACPDCTKHLAEAGALYQGDFLADLSLKDSVAFEEWARVQRERLHREVIEALGHLSQCHEYRGELREALEVARQQVEIDPLWEAGQRRLMRLLALSGQPSAALEQYESCKHLLASELAVPPEKETQVLVERISREARAELPLTHLPAPTSPLIGRKEELAELHGYLHDPDCRLLTVLGPGGCGKTRLALEAARAVQYSFRDGVYLISLSALDPSQSFVPVVAEALGFSFHEQGEPRQQLLDYLCQKSLLLVMDSFEAVLPGAAWVSEVLRAAPQIKFLVTSRASLKISDEQVFTLGGMEVPAPDELEMADQFEAVQLFLAFARHRQPGFVLDDHSRSGVVRICRLVHGLPLGLLLASSWVGLYSLDEIAGQIERSLDFLEVDWSDMPARQRSLQATFDYSWNLLSEEEQCFFTALAVFHGSFSMPAVRRMAEASPRLLQSLVDKSLVSRTPVGRYQVHDLVHQFAVQRLEQDQEHASDIHTRHSRYYLEALEEWKKELKSARQREVLEVMDQEVENLRAAWRWAVTTLDWQGIACALEGMGWYADLRFRFQEGERACRTARENIPQLSYSHLASALAAWQAHFLRKLDRSDDAWQLLRDELVRLGALQAQGGNIRPEQAQVLYELGELYMYTDRVTAKGYYQQSLEMFQEIGDGENSGKVLSRLGEMVHHAGEYVLAGQLLSQALTLLQAAGEPRRLANNLRWLGFNEIRQGRIAEGEPCIRQAIEVRRQICDRSGEAQSLDDYGTVLAWRGRYQEAKEWLEQSLPIYEELGMHAKVAWALALIGLINNNNCLYDEARQVGLRCIQFASQKNFPREQALGYVSLGLADLGEGKYDQAYPHLLQAIEVGRSIPQSDELAGSLGLLSLAELGLGQVEQARRHLCEALEINLKTHGMFSANLCLPVAAVMLSRVGEVEKAIEVQAMMLRYPPISGSSWYEDTCWRYINQASSALPPQVVQARRERGRQRDLFSTAEELLKELSGKIGDDKAGQSVH